MDCYFRQSWVDKRLSFSGYKVTLWLFIKNMTSQFSLTFTFLESFDTSFSWIEYLLQKDATIDHLINISFWSLDVQRLTKSHSRMHLRFPSRCWGRFGSQVEALEDNVDNIFAWEIQTIKEKASKLSF